MTIIEQMAGRLAHILFLQFFASLDSLEKITELKNILVVAGDQIFVRHHDIELAWICAAVLFVKKGNMDGEIEAMAIEAGFRPGGRHREFFKRQGMKLEFSFELQEARLRPVRKNRSKLFFLFVFVAYKLKRKTQNAKLQLKTYFVFDLVFILVLLILYHETNNLENNQAGIRNICRWTRVFCHIYIPSGFAGIIRLAVNILIKRLKNTAYFGADGWVSNELSDAIRGRRGGNDPVEIASLNCKVL